MSSVSDRSDEAVVDAVLVCIDAHRARDLHVLVVAVEERDVGDRATIHPRGLETSLVGVQVFRTEAFADLRSCEVRSSWVETASLEALAVTHVCVGVFVDAIAQVDTRREVGVGTLRFEIATDRDSDRTRCTEERGGQTKVVRTEDIRTTLIIRVATARGDGHASLIW